MDQDVSGVRGERWAETINDNDEVEICRAGYVIWMCEWKDTTPAARVHRCDHL